MAAVARTRVLDKSTPVVGQANRPNYGWVNTYVKTAVDRKVTGDVVGNYPNPNGFNSIHTKSLFPVVNGQFFGWNGALEREYIDCPVEWTPHPSAPLISYLPIAISANEMGRRALIQSNPWTADINLPAFIGELRDFPGLLRHFGATSIRAFQRRMKELRATFRKPSQALRLQAETNLAWRFGVAPMVGDLKKLLDFQRLAARRIDVLKRMRKNGGIKRRFQIGTVLVNTPPVYNRAIESRLAWISGTEFLQSERQQWSTVRWDLKEADSLPSDNAALARLARRAVIGMNWHGLLETMWELTPWSWLIDWFWDFGSFLKRHNNTVPVVPSRVCVMTTTRCTRYVIPTSIPEWVTLTGPYQMSWIEKDRKVVSPDLADLPEFKVPLLSLGQLSILGSLAVTRMVTR